MGEKSPENKEKGKSEQQTAGKTDTIRGLGKTAIQGKPKGK